MKHQRKPRLVKSKATNSFLYQQMQDTHCKVHTKNIEVFTYYNNQVGRKPCPEIVKGLRRNSVNLNIDNLDAMQIRAMVSCLPKLQKLRKIVLWGKHFENEAQNPQMEIWKTTPGGLLSKRPQSFIKPDQGPRYYNQPRPYNKQDSEAHIDPGTVCLSRDQSITNKLFGALYKNLVTNTTLTYLKIVGLNLSEYSWKKLGKCLLGKFNLDYCIITHCKLNDQSLNLLANGLKRQITMRRLDLSNNFLANDCGFILARVLSAHSEGKDELIWMFGLRNEYPSLSLLDYGVYEISLANNQITDRAIFDLSEALHFNNWLQSLDLRKNQISIQGLKELCSILKSNDKLKYLDVRQNLHEVPQQIKKVIYKGLRRNIKSKSKQPEVPLDFKSKLIELKKQVLKQPQRQGSPLKFNKYNSTTNTPIRSRRTDSKRRSTPKKKVIRSGSDQLFKNKTDKFQLFDSISTQMPNSHVIFIQRDNKLSPMDNALTPNNRKIQDKVEHLMVEMAELMKIVKNRR